MIQLPEIKVSVTIDGKGTAQHKISNSQDAYALAKHIFNQDTISWTEEMVMLCLSRSQHVIGYFKVASGGMAGVIVDPKVIFTIALKSCAHSFILMHNHPSGNTQPSTEDEKVTDKVKNAGKLLDIKLLDHIIVTTDSFYSFADNGLI